MAHSTLYEQIKLIVEEVELSNYNHYFSYFTHVGQEKIILLCTEPATA